MGWSCTAKAGRTLDRIGISCYNLTGFSNGFRDAVKGGGSVDVFWERGREQSDGSITGSVFYWDGRTKGTFKIDADGNVVRGSAAFKALAKSSSWAWGS